jgi:hypothetical protein
VGEGPPLDGGPVPTVVGLSTGADVSGVGPAGASVEDGLLAEGFSEAARVGLSTGVLGEVDPLEGTLLVGDNVGDGSPPEGGSVSSGPWLSAGAGVWLAAGDGIPIAGGSVDVGLLSEGGSVALSSVGLSTGEAVGLEPDVGISSTGTDVGEASIVVGASGTPVGLFGSSMGVLFGAVVGSEPDIVGFPAGVSDGDGFAADGGSVPSTVGIP